jgi:hypothetical protein
MKENKKDSRNINKSILKFNNSNKKSNKNSVKISKNLII